MKCSTTQGSSERFMNMCRHHEIDLWQIDKKEKFCFSICVNDFKKIHTIVRKTGICPHIEKKMGFPFVFYHLIRNWTFSSGFVFFLVLLALMSSFVWEISFHGQSTYTKETLQKTVNELGIHRGMKRNRLNCDDIEKGLRQKYPDISWVSAEEKGSRLVISIKEAEKVVKRQSEEMPCHLIALEDGIVKELSVNRGIALVKKGQKVKKGQILIQGIIPITDDGDQVVEKMPVTAKGTIKLYVEKEFTHRVSGKKKIKKYTGKKIQLYKWQLGNSGFSVKNPFKRFNNSYKYDIMSIKKLNFDLQPFSIMIDMDQYIFYEYQWKMIELNQRQLKEEGKQICDKWKRQIESADHRIISHSAHMNRQNKEEWLVQARFGYLCNQTKKKYIQQEEWQVDRKAEESEDGET